MRSRNLRKRPALLAWAALAAVFLTGACQGCAKAGETAVTRAAASGDGQETLNPTLTQYETDTNRYTQYAGSETGAAGGMTTDGFEKKMESEELELWFREESQSLRVVDRRSGYVWGCTAQDKPENLNKKWSAKANSLCTITYYDEQNSEETAALSESELSARYVWKDRTAECTVTSKKLGISFSFTITLEGASLRFAVDDASLSETRDNKLKSVSFVSFFGSVEQDSVSGYFLIPDGSGALMRFEKSRAYQSGFEKRVYGSDAGIDKNSELSNLNGNRTDDYATPVNTVCLPVYGVVHGEDQNGFLAVIDSGEEYATISAMPSGVSNIDYSRVSARFDYRQLYDYKVSASKSITVPQEEVNPVNAGIRYYFLTGGEADYSGMAVFYRELLEADGTLTDRKEESGDIPLLLNVMGSEVRDGFLKNSLRVLTTAEQALDISEDLADAGAARQTMVYSGWLAGGYSGVRYGALSVESRLGSNADLDRLRDAVQARGGLFALSVNPVTANKDQISLARQAGVTRSKNEAYYEIPNKSLMYPLHYFIKPERIASYLQALSQSRSGDSLHFEQLGTVLNSDATRGRAMTRTAVRDALLEAVRSTGRKVLLDNANRYWLSLADALTSVPVSGSQYMYETDSVPFLQIVLRGSVEYYAPYANQGLYSKSGVLKMIEYGAYPSFMVMAADNFELYRTPLEDYFSLNYDDWKDTVISVYQTVNAALSQVTNAKIRRHVMLAEGVAAVEYDNGRTVYVNYNPTAYTADGLTVPAQGFAVGETMV